MEASCSPMVHAFRICKPLGISSGEVAFEENMADVFQPNEHGGKTNGKQKTESFIGKKSMISLILFFLQWIRFNLFPS